MARAASMVAIDCWNCGKTGHYKSDCPELKVEGVDNGVQNLSVEECNDSHGLLTAQDEVECTLTQGSGRGVRGILSPDHLYIDTCATYASMPYAHLLDNLRKQMCGLCGHTNSGSTTMNEAGNLGAIKKMWLNEGGVASVIPLKILEKIWPVLYHSVKGMNPGHFVIHLGEGDVVKRNNKKGIPYLNLKEVKAEVALCLLQSAIDTIRGKMEGFSKREVKEATAARKAQGMLGHPTDHEFLGMVRSNMITNCTVTESAIKNAHIIFGPDLAGVRGGTVRRAPESVRVDHIQIPRVILYRHRIVTLTMDCMFINGVPFLVSTSRGLNLITAEHTPSQTMKNLASGIRRIMDLYAHGGFQVGAVLMDNEFESLQNLVPIIVVNTTAAKEHVPEIKRRIRLIKEQGRGILNTLPYKKMPQLMLIELIYHVVLWLNASPIKSGVFATLSPQEIVLRHKLDFAKHCKAIFGSYCEAHNEPVPSNMMATRASPAIVLGPTGNLQGTYKLLNLAATGKKFKRHSFTVYLMPDSVIKQIEALGQQNLPGVFNFLDRNGMLFEWNNNVDKYTKGLVEEDIVLYPLLVAEFLGITLDREVPVPSIEEEIIPHGQAKDAAAHNSNVPPFVAAGVNHGPAAIHASDNKIGKYDNEDDDIIVVANIPHRNAPTPEPHCHPRFRRGRCEHQWRLGFGQR